MYRLRSFMIRILNLFRRSRLDADLAEQLNAHRELIKADLIERGMDRAEAEKTAWRAVGNEPLLRDLSRDQMVHRWIDNILSDTRYTLRTLARTPLFTVTVVLTLALGIGANTAIFSLVDRLLLRPLPFPNGEQIVLLHEASLKNSRMDVSPANWLDWQRESQTFEGLAAWTHRYPSTLTGQGEPEKLETDSVSYEFFPVLGVKPLLGRVFTANDDRPNTQGTAVISYSLWQRKFAGDMNIVGRVVELNARPVEVIGVMPSSFRFLSSETDIWQSFSLDRNLPWRNIAGRFLPYVVGRVKSSVTVAAARGEMQGIASGLARQYIFNKDTSVVVVPLREAMTGEVRTSLLMLFVAVGVLLLIACSNVANLLIARAAHRRREVAIRTSLGATRGAIVRQLVIESLLLAVTGGIVGVFIAQWGIRVLVALAPANLTQVADLSIDRSMLLYTFALSVATGILVGLAPAMPARRLSITDYLRTGGRSVTASMRLRQGLIAAQVAMAVVLLCGAGLLVRSLVELARDKTGVVATDVLSLRVELPDSRYNDGQQVAFFQELTERLRNLPGVEAAGAARDRPVSTLRISGTSFRILGQPEAAPADRPSTRVRVVTPGYFKTLGIPVLKGREYGPADLVENAAQTFVVNEAFVKKFFPSEDPLNASISVNMRRNSEGRPDNPFGEIIGVVGNVKEGTLRGAPEPTVFYNHRQLPFSGMTLFVRSRRGPEIAREAADIVRQMDRNLPVVEVRMLEDAFADTLGRERLNAVVSGAFAVAGLLLASLGLYGLMAYAVAERTNEIGIRMALGARPSQVLRVVIAEGMRVVLFGAGIGLITAFATSRLLDSLLFGVTTHDALTFGGVILLLVAVSLIAVMIPGRRAIQVNPIVALREE